MVHLHIAFYKPDMAASASLAPLADNDDQEWEAFKETIRSLYLADGLTLPALINEMKARYDFAKM